MTKVARVMRLGILALALSVSAGATAQNGGAMPPNISPQNNASAQSDALPQTPPTPAQLDQSGAVVIPPPILRNTGRTVVAPDQPLLGRLNLQAQTLQGLVREEPPAIQPAPNEAATSSVLGNASAAGQVHD